MKEAYQLGNAAIKPTPDMLDLPQQLVHLLS
jgi:hypothetical protein